MRMAPEGRIVNVHLAICCAPAARKPPETTLEEWHFQMPGPGTALVRPPRDILGTSQRLCSQWGFQKTSSTGVMTPCGAFVGETARVEAASARLTHRPKIITLPYLGPSPWAAPLWSRQGAISRLLSGACLQPDQNYWHSTAAQGQSLHCGWPYSVV
ncbi:hypothetical protein CgunFtcFv8_020123 [Champsocephalus gunnari]|uniref:Uncharacterized protein n=1 Tax=Champsocephalus gunnari TaxID=52237 RepID=A0AAN8HNT5_CHAGU|nr:hypothetical protein CgunFtcFv8_020123 [Champsocephalus gunnari]